MLNFFWQPLAELLARPAIATRVIERALGTDHFSSLR